VSTGQKGSKSTYENECQLMFRQRILHLCVYFVVCYTECCIFLYLFSFLWYCSLQWSA